MVRNTSRPIAISNRNRVLRRGLGAATGHLFYPLQGVRLGDLNCDQDGNCYDTETQTYTPAPVPSTGPQCGIDLMCGPQATAGELAAAGYPLATAVSTPGAPSSNPTSLAIALAQDATQLAAPIVRSATQQAPYYVTNPATGQSVLYNPNTGTTGGIGSSLSSISPTMVFAIVASFIGMLAFSKK